MLRLIPFAIAALAIAALTFVEGSITDRWVDVNRESAFCSTLLAEVPDVIGDWEGTDEEVDPEIQKTAGAQGYVSRAYRNKVTGRLVDVWLIVGHARDTAEHTPDSCYPSSGFQQKDDNANYTMNVEGETPATFWTAIFHKSSPIGTTANRVYWAWFKPTLGGNDDGAATVDWIAPSNPRFHFGSTRALYKLYFTAAAKDVDESPDDSVCLEFADQFLPILNDILAQANDGVPSDYDASEASAPGATGGAA